jgi:hypothetical protein
MAASVPHMQNADRTIELVALEQELTLALRDYEVFGTPGLHETVLLALCACVDAMRALSWAPESVVVAIKRIARRAGFGSLCLTSARWNPVERDFRLDGFVTCAIARYFQLSPTTLHHPPIWTPVSLVC